MTQVSRSQGRQSPKARGKQALLLSWVYREGNERRHFRQRDQPSRGPEVWRTVKIQT
jgi:hypothetical protein